MCAKYTFYKNPPNRETGETGSLYAKVVSGGKVTTDNLADEIADICSFSSADVKGDPCFVRQVGLSFEIWRNR